MLFKNLFKYTFKGKELHYKEKIDIAHDLKLICIYYELK